MKSFKMLVLASTLIVGGMTAASAQSGSQPGGATSGGATGTVSAATHCRDADGQIKLKSAAMQGSGAAGSTTGAASGSSGSSGSMGGSASGSAGSGSADGSASSNIAATLPRC